MDGVLNSTQSSHYYWKLKDRQTFMNDFDTVCPIACSNFQNILENVPDLKIVISSTWRLFHEIEEWDKIAHRIPLIKGSIIDKTPVLDGKQRGDEIYFWLEKNGHLNTKYVVVDDDGDMDKVKNNFFKIDHDHGLTWKDSQKIINHLMEE